MTSKLVSSPISQASHVGPCLCGGRGFSEQLGMGGGQALEEDDSEPGLLGEEGVVVEVSRELGGASTGTGWWRLDRGASLHFPPGPGNAQR